MGAALQTLATHLYHCQSIPRKFNKLLTRSAGRNIYEAVRCGAHLQNIYRRAELIGLDKRPAPNVGGSFHRLKMRGRARVPGEEGL